MKRLLYAFFLAPLLALGGPAAKADLILDYITGVAQQCLQADTTGHVTGTGVACGASGGGTTTNGLNGNGLTSNGSGGFGTPVVYAAGIVTWETTPSSANLFSAMTTKTGTGGNLVFSTAPVLTTPDLGTPSAANLANATNLPYTSITSMATGAAAFLGAGTSATLRGFVTDETGTGGGLVFATSPTLTTPNLGVPSAVDLTNAVNVPGAQLTANSVTNAKMATVAAHTIKGNNTASSATPLDLTATQVTAEINPFTGDAGSGGVKGAVPAPAAGDAAAGKVLGAGGSWIAIAAGSGSPGGADGSIQYRVNSTTFGGVTLATGLNMSSGTLSLTSVLNDQTAATGGNYSITAPDAAKSVLVVGGGVTTLPDATITGFGLGWSTCVLNQGTTNSTISTASSLLKGAGGGTTLSLRRSDTACPTSDGTNYSVSYLYSGLGHLANALMLGGGNTAPPTAMSSLGTTGQVLHANTSGAPTWAAVDCSVDTCTNFPRAVTFGWIRGADIAADPSVLYTAATPATVISIRGRVQNPLGTAGSLIVYKAPSGTACASGTPLHTSTFNAAGTANTNQTLTLSSTPSDLTLATGDSICTAATGTFGGGVGSGSLTVTVRIQ